MNPKMADYSFEHPAPEELARAGFVAAGRYLSRPVDNPKNLTGAELVALHGAGLAVVVVWETTATRPLGGAPAGAEDGRDAAAMLDGFGWPAGIPVHWAFDAGITPSSFPACGDYADAFARAVGREARPYGPGELVAWIVENRRGGATGGWQWAGAGSNVAEARIRQRDGVRLPAELEHVPGIDENDLLSPDYGGWLPGVTPGRRKARDVGDPVVATIKGLDGSDVLVGALVNGGRILHTFTGPASEFGLADADKYAADSGMPLVVLTADEWHSLEAHTAATSSSSAEPAEPAPASDPVTAETIAAGVELAFERIGQGLAPAVAEPAKPAEPAPVPASSSPSSSAAPAEHVGPDLSGGLPAV